MNAIEKMAEDPRVTVRKPGVPGSDGHCVVYWMQRAQRGIDNHALNCAVNLANELRQPVVVFFAPVPFYPHANLRHYAFLSDGIGDIAKSLLRRKIGFVLRAYPDHKLARFCEEVQASVVIGDENPLREPEVWRRRFASQCRVPFWTVDADVIVPSALLGHEHFAARTIRPKIHELLSQFSTTPTNPSALVPWPAPVKLKSLSLESDITCRWSLDRSVQPVSTGGGTGQALCVLRRFVKDRLADYPDRRNHPELDGTSRLSAYLHFGQIGPHTVAREIRNADAPETAKQAFLEQLIVRRELAINFVHYNPTYDSIEAAEAWAHRSIAEHRGDRRPIAYSDKQLENAETHDDLWNAAQKQMVLTGWMHNYMRMYWAKKILEWSPSVAVALQRAIRLNDRYELDGRDPNGYAGIAWSILGKHDRAWPERPVFGKVRYMSAGSISRKFNSRKYIEQVAELERRGRS